MDIVLMLCFYRYGQMTAGSYCYIGPQGIVHGTLVCKKILSFQHKIQINACLVL